MHELGLCTSIVDAIETTGRRAAGGPGPGAGRAPASRASRGVRAVVLAWPPWARSPRMPPPNWSCSRSVRAAAAVRQLVGVRRNARSLPCMRLGGHRAARRRRAGARVDRVPRLKGKRHVSRDTGPAGRIRRQPTTILPGPTSRGLPGSSTSGCSRTKRSNPGTGSSSTSGSPCRRSTRRRRTWLSPR